MPWEQLLGKEKSGAPQKLLACVLSQAFCSMLLVSCAAPLPHKLSSPTFAVRAAQADLAYGPAALDRTVSQFLAPAREPSTGAPSFGFSEAGPGSHSPSVNATLDYSALSGFDSDVSGMLTQQLSETWQADYTLRMGQGRAAYIIPEGQLSIPLGSFSVIIDEPTQLRARTYFIEAEAIALRTIPTPIPGEVALGVGSGVRATQSDLSVTSGLLAIESRHRQTQPYAVVQARYRPPRMPAQAFVEGRAYGRNAAGLRAGVQLMWP